MDDAPQASRPLVIKLFGGMEVLVRGAALPKLRSRKELWLLALLALNADRPVARVWLAQTLWPFPDYAADQSAYNLRRGLCNLRKALGEEAHRLQSPTPATLRLDLAGAEGDTTTFDAAIMRNDPVSLQAAVACYAGPLLKECTETWAIVERERRQQQYLQALNSLSAYASIGGDYETAIGYLRQIAAVDPLWEPAQRALMEALAQSGDSPAALQAYQEFSQRLHRERSAYPDPETTALYQALRDQLRERGETSGKASLPPSAPPAALSPPMRRVPVPLTPLIGREDELREIETRFRLSRLLTLTGAGGVGKTRLAIQLAEELAGEFRDGACFVDMAALTDAAQVVQITAAALDVQEKSEHALTETLVDFLRPRQLLLILDNCEHLLDAAARLAETLLQNCRALRILATSRQSLGVGGEAVWRVSSLSLPDPRLLPTDAEALATLLGAYAAIRLFVERASQAQSNFRLTPENAAHVAQICRQLDGIPLALELAAARVHALPVERIAERLEDRFRLLTTGPRTALSRQQTLEAAIKWSFDLLSEADRDTLCALSVFVGGWTLEAAEAVTAKDEGRRMKNEARNVHPSSFLPHPSDVLDSLTRLVDRSLVIYEGEGSQARYRMLETVRQYCREKLRDNPALRPARERHLDYFLHIAEQARAALQGTSQARWLDRLEREHDNLRAALEWSAAEIESKVESAVEIESSIEVKPKDVERGLQLAGALWRFWHRRGYLGLGRRYLAVALAQTQTLGDTPARAEALNGAGMLAFFQGDSVAARQDFEAALAIGTRLGDEALQATALHSLGQMAWNRRDYRQARELLTYALALQRKLQNRMQTAITLNYLGVVASDAGDFDGARAYLEESLSIGRELGDKALIANSLHSLAHMAFYQEDYDQARAYYGEELKLARSLHNRDMTATALHRLGCVEHAARNYPAARSHLEESLVIVRELAYRDLLSAVVFSLGNTARALGDYDTAQACYGERLQINQEAGDRLGLSYVLDGFAALLVARHQEHRAVTLFAAAHALRESLVAPASVVNQNERPSLLAARSALGEAAFAQAWEEGRALSPEEAVCRALQNREDTRE